MTPDSQPQSQQTHGSQPEIQKPKKQSRLKKWLRNAILDSQTKEEIKEQVKEKIQALIISENVKIRLNRRLEKEFIKFRKIYRKG